MRFGVLGETAVWTDAGRPVRVPELKVRALLASLLAHAGQPVATSRLIDDLWGDEPPGNPARSLQAKVSQLRGVLEAAETGARDLVATRAPGYQLVLPPEEPDALDARRFARLAARARTAPDAAARIALLREALGLWRGPAFADFAEEPFAQAAVARLADERLVALEALADARLELGEHAEVVAELAEQVARHPLREQLRAVYLRALYGAGRQSEALAGYEDLRARLADELGVDPSPALAALHGAMLRQDAALDAPAAGRGRGGRGPTPPRTNLIAPPLGDLVGRDEAIGEVAALLAERRLVTLTGPGGVGKTRLALAVMEKLRGTYPDGEWVVELAGAAGGSAGAAGRMTGPDDGRRAGAEGRRAGTDGRRPGSDGSRPGSDGLRPGVGGQGPGAGGRLAETAAVALGLRDDGTWGRRPEGEADPGAAGRLAAALAGRRMLLVLDNCEHVVDEAAELVELLLRSVPGLTVLTTSQEALALAGETLWAVPPLAPGSALELFTARAAAAAPGFTLDAAGRTAAEAICRRLDGIPLALELAATRVRALGVHQLEQRLDDRFRLLSAGQRGAPARQQTLRAVIDWSWELLTAPEQAVLRRLAVHAEGCTLDAAEAVCAGDGVAARDVLGITARLVDRSLVVAAPDGSRYRLLESVAAYCLERLDEAGERESVATRHLEWYADLAAGAEPRLRGPEQLAWLERLDAESANLRAAFATAVRRGSARDALRLVDALGWYWIMRGRLVEALRSAADALALPGGDAAPRARVGVWRTGFAILTGNGTKRTARIGAAVGAYENAYEQGDAGASGWRGPAWAGWFLGHTLCGTGSMAEGEELTGRALAAFREQGDGWGEAAALGDRAVQRLLKGDLAEAAGAAERSAELFAGAGDACSRLWAVYPLASLAEIHGDYARATELWRGGLDVARRFGASPQAVDLQAGLGRVALLAGDLAAAYEHHEAARCAATEIGFRAGEINARLGLALTARRDGRLDAAEAHLHAVLEWHREVGLNGANALVLAELGFVAELRGDAEEARGRQEEGYETALTTGDPRALALSLEGMAAARTLTDTPAALRDAALLLGAAAAARRAAGAPLPAAERGDVNRATARIREALGAAEAAEALRRGEGFSPEEAVAGSGG
ncbi:BTAD domain-containing putative transcriptional regulator [Streptomyces sp. WMMC500]|uniref:BTAD domain-containing putative transcriptional regulator n=1 Tax=Streptomyces sp. WMMC500 TaxID=3015154 RepID=UPI00248AD14B|nr:BTAD domain-containing putative transcriptional regulator [Streptomyces sp. WMMC500]WBB63831.1 BTAD domain-containing putative transcriptional regulator [Streptomyces sp. WMMC500]